MNAASGSAARQGIPGERDAAASQGADQRLQVRAITAPAPGRGAVDGPADLRGAGGQGYGCAFLHLDRLRAPGEAAVLRQGGAQARRIRHEFLVDDLVDALAEARAPVAHEPLV